MDIVIPNELAEEDDEEELPTPDVALLPHLKYGEILINSDLITNFIHFYSNRYYLRITLLLKQF